MIGDFELKLEEQRFLELERELAMQEAMRDYMEEQYDRAEAILEPHVNKIIEYIKKHFDGSERKDVLDYLFERMIVA